jgi:hypothetical protein
MIKRLLSAFIVGVFALTMAGCVYDSNGHVDILGSVDQGSQELITDLQGITRAANQAQLAAVNDICSYAPAVYPLWDVAINVKDSNGNVLMPASIINDGNNAEKALKNFCSYTPFTSFTMEAADAVNAWNEFLSDTVSGNVSIPEAAQAKIRAAVMKHVSRDLRNRIAHDAMILGIRRYPH